MTKKEDVLTQAQRIWQQVKGIDIKMYALPHQTLEQHVDVVEVEPSKLYLVLKSSSVLQGIEDYVLPLGYKLSQVSRFTVLEQKGEDDLV